MPLKALPTLVFLAFCVTTSALAQQHTITISPTSVRAGTSISIGVTSSTGLDLSKVAVGQVLIHPAKGVGNLQAIPQSSGGLSVQFTLDQTTPLGDHTLIIVFPDNKLVSATFTVTRAAVGCSNPKHVCCAFRPNGDCARCQFRCPAPDNGRPPKKPI